jgi:hypothetical protein
VDVIFVDVGEELKALWGECSRPDDAEKRP